MAGYVQSGRGILQSISTVHWLIPCTTGTTFVYAGKLMTYNLFHKKSCVSYVAHVYALHCKYIYIYICFLFIH